MRGDEMEVLSFGHCLHVARKRAHLSRRELAEISGYSAKTIFKWEKGICKARPVSMEDMGTALPELDYIRKYGCRELCGGNRPCESGKACWYGN